MAFGTVEPMLLKSVTSLLWLTDIGQRTTITCDQLINTQPREQEFIIKLRLLSNDFVVPLSVKCRGKFLIRLHDYHIFRKYSEMFSYMNSVDSDQTTHNGWPHQCLYCIPMFCQLFLRLTKGLVQIKSIQWTFTEIVPVSEYLTQKRQKKMK